MLFFCPFFEITHEVYVIGKKLSMRKLALSDENLYKQKVTQNISTFRNIILAIIVCTEDR